MKMKCFVKTTSYAHCTYECLNVVFICHIFMAPNGIVNWTWNSLNGRSIEVLSTFPLTRNGQGKDVMQRKLFQKCTHLLYCSVLSLGGNVNTRRMSKPDM